MGGASPSVPWTLKEGAGDGIPPVLPLACSVTDSVKAALETESMPVITDGCTSNDCDASWVLACG